MKIEDRLYLVKFKPDKVSHLKIIDREVCRKCEFKPCLFFCPAEVYSWDDETTQVNIAYEGCFECGACRIGCPYANIDWRYPRGGFGVTFRYG